MWNLFDSDFVLKVLGITDLDTAMTVILRLLVSFFVGAVIGLERERYFRDRNAPAAGFRTYTLVCFGSCLFGIVSELGFSSSIPNVAGNLVDPGRVAAQVVTGVGFLGAGAIIFEKGRVKGLTTAAGLWLCAGLGLAFGAGLIFYGLVAAAIAYIVLDFHRLFPRLFKERAQSSGERVSKDEE